MSRNLFVCSEDHYYHVTSRSNQKLWFSIPLEEVWSLSLKSLSQAQIKIPCIISQYVLMNNHYHLLIKCPEGNLAKFMYFFNKDFSTQLRIKSGLENRMFGGRYKRSLIDTQNYLQLCYFYIYQNPLRAGIVPNCELYPYSTLHYEFTKKLDYLPFQLCSILEKIFVHGEWYNLTTIDHTNDILNFLNKKFTNEKVDEIKKGLKKKIFKPVVLRKY